MSDEAKVTVEEQIEGTTETGEQTENKGTGTEAKVPSLDELSLEVAKLQADTARYKNMITKLTKENKTLSDWKKERMTAQEIETEEQAKAKAEHDAEFKRLQDFEQITLKTNKFLGMGMNPGLAREAAQAELNGDNESLSNYYKQFNDEQIKAAKAEWLKSRPDIEDQRTEEADEDKKLHNAFFAN